MPDERELQALLRLKRYEQPPPEYFESFLREFQRRQREELLRQPLWRIALERVGTFFSEHSMPRLSYGTAAACVMAVAAVVSFRIVMTPVDEEATIASVRPVHTQPVAAQVLTLDEGTRAPFHFTQPLNVRENLRAGSVPRYVIDARPAVYEPSFGF